MSAIDPTAVLHPDATVAERRAWVNGVIFHVQRLTRERDDALADAARLREALKTMVSTARGDASGVAIQIERLDMLREIVDVAMLGDDYQLADWIREHLLPHAERLGLGPVDGGEQEA